ncbi:acid protease [Lojkania enalia]|uniref:Acid protease n=1 Tax=Lojkania enalia TaxID=147567 RepID=A0A9P4TS71_9PLEO|nr:acid protease [Didymosphaeria enalia]
MFHLLGCVSLRPTAYHGAQTQKDKVRSGAAQVLHPTFAAMLSQILLGLSVFKLAEASPLIGSDLLERTLKPGQEILSTGASKRFSAPIETNGFIHTVNITIGTPPQHFNVSLDFESNEFFVPSVECTNHSYYCDAYLPFNKFNASTSRTYRPNGTRATALYQGVEYHGPLSYDTIRISDLAIEQQLFMEYNESHAVTWFGTNWGYDGLLGLAPPWNSETKESDPLPYPNYLRLLQDKQVLEENVMALKFPRRIGERGEIMFGGINPDLFTGDFAKAKIVGEDEVQDPFDAMYNIRAESVTFNSSVPFQLSLNSTPAVITTEPWIYLPREIFEVIYYGIGAKQLDILYSYIPCERRPFLPELTFNIAGHDLTVNAFDYTYEVEMRLTPEKWVTVCLVSIGPSDDLGYEPIVLGSTFLRGFYTVFDLDNREIGFAQLKK